MGIFGGYFNSVGPGVPKDGPKKKGVALYFELFFRHFWDFCKENMMYVLASIPMVGLLYFTFSFFDVLSIADADLRTAEIIKVLVIALFVILCGTGPASASMAYMMRCVTREEHCFLWSDFIEKFKQNFKNSIILTILDYLLLIFILPIATKFYYMQYLDTGNILWFIMCILVVQITVIYVMAHAYFYQFAITFENNFKGHLTNSVKMALAKFPMTLLLALIPLILTFVFSLIFQVTFVWIIIAVCWFAFMRYPLEFYAARVISKKLLETKKEN